MCHNFEIGYFGFCEFSKIHSKPLNVIILGQTKSITLPGPPNDNINPMITITDEIYLPIFSNWDLEMWSHWATDNINLWFY